MSNDYLLHYAAFIILSLASLLYAVLLQKKNQLLKALLNKKEFEIEHKNVEMNKNEISLAQSTANISELKKNLAVNEEQKRNLIEKASLQEKKLEEIENRFSLQFENLANKIFEKKIEVFQNSSNKNLHEILAPFKEKIHHFQTKVEQIYNDEARERYSLKNEIKNIIQTNQKMSLETINLTKALKGDVKAQGNWGEIVLEKILENSGLREGEEYISQGKNLGLKDENGKLQKPDIIVNLPEGKSIIIDSKVSLTHYERYISSECESKELEFKNFIDSLTGHLKDLSSKSYQMNDKLITPDFVLMFFPIEGAFSLALQKNAKMFQWAWERSIIIVSPTTLLATLKTVHSIWRQEKSNKNALLISQESGKLYDKMAIFLEEMVRIGDSIKKAESCYQQAYSKLSTGRGNILSRLDKIKVLGAKAQKHIEIQE